MTPGKRSGFRKSRFLMKTPVPLHSSDRRVDFPYLSCKWDSEAEVDLGLDCQHEADRAYHHASPLCPTFVLKERSKIKILDSRNSYENFQ